ncbi:MAG: helix-turn-helix transcriptional regulator [Bacteroidia bacterium]|nr:helix-turn-helix transcriptional regulator [Bacteroidia bacterium]
MSNINNDIHRFVMVIETSNYLNRLEANQFNLFTQKLHNSLLKSFNHFKGKILVNNDNMYIVKFKSVTNTILCALKIHDNFKYITPKFDKSIRQLKIGIASGSTDNIGSITKVATRICEMVKDQIVVTTQVRKLYEEVNKNSFINKEHIKTLKPENEIFINKIMDFSETIWANNDFNVNDFSKKLGYSRAQVYRKLKMLTGKSPSRFLREFRLKKALKLLHDKKSNITQVAMKAGFNSLTYFTKCFKSRFGILPSKYVQQH